MEKVRIGIIGVGRMGEFHLQKYLALSEAQVVGVFEPDSKRHAHLTSTYGVTVFPTLQSLLFEADAVVIASHTQAHFLTCKQALEAGVHALVEKPLCDNIEEASELIEIAERNQLILQVGYLERFRLNRFVAHLSSRDVQYADLHWLATSLPRESSLDVIGDILVHPLDMALSLFGEAPTEVSATAKPFLTPLNDFAQVHLSFSRGRKCNLTVSRVSSHRERRCFLITPNEQASFNFLSNHVETVHAKNGELHKTSYTLDEKTPLFDALLEQSRSFIHSVKTNSIPHVSGIHALDVLHTIQQIRATMIMAPTTRVKNPLHKETPYGA